MRDDGGFRDSETNDGMCRGATDCALEVIGRECSDGTFSGVRRDEARHDGVRGNFLMKTDFLHSLQSPFVQKFECCSRTIYCGTSKPQSKG